MTTALLIFPHQLFADHPGLREKPDEVLLIEDPLFFGDAQYPAKFHTQKLWLHRATMKRYAQALEADGYNVRYVDCAKAETSALIKSLDVETLFLVDPHDHTLEKRLREAAAENNMVVETLDTPMFINTPALNADYRAGKKRWFMADYYKFQRTRLDVLMDEGGKPTGGQWSFDEDNRKKVPKKLLGDIPQIMPRTPDDLEKEAVSYVEANWPENPGSLEQLWYATDHAQATQWLDKFLHDRFHLFGDYEDAIVEGESWLWHSVLTPALNIGLLTPRQVVNETLAFAEKHDVPINAVEGFLRQIIGWREFMRATYDDLHVKMRTTNHWNHTRKLPDSFYNGTTGILPVDDTIKRINDTAYAHHIERLMVLGGFMFLCEIDPDDIYRWFMEMFIDSYDWVMVPNAYAMSQNADGGLITTKPYFSGSAYVKKMSHHKHAPWADTWDGLYWRWIWNHKEELGKNPRWAMMCRAAEKMDEAKMKTHLKNADAFLRQL